MTTRSRPRPADRTYTARLHRRTAAPRQAPGWLTWLTTRHLPALLTLCAEAGHLAAALIEWPVAPARGLFHVLVAAGLGPLAVAVYCGRTRVELAGGIALALAAPAAWLAGTLLGISPYQNYAQPAAFALTAMEIALAMVLTAHWPGVRPRIHST